MYNYKEAVMNDVRAYIESEIDLELYRGRRDDLEEKLNDDLFTCDSVTGNGSGSYTFNRYEAGMFLAGNFDLLFEALHEFCTAIDFLEKGEEACDVTIRCYLLGEAVSEVLDELEESGAFEETDE